MTALRIEMPVPTSQLDRIHGCILPIVAGAGAGVTSLAMADWRAVTANATAAIGLAGLVGGSVVGGVIYAITKFDQVKIDRQKKYDEANKDSLSAQMAESIRNQELMRATLHKISNEAQRAQAENAELRDDLATLRDQFMGVSKRLYATDMALNAAQEEMRRTRLELQKTTDLLATTERDRNALRAELDALRRAQAGQGERLTKLEQVGSGSADNVPIPKGLLGDTAAPGVPSVATNTPPGTPP